MKLPSIIFIIIVAMVGIILGFWAILYPFGIKIIVAYYLTFFIYYLATIVGELIKIRKNLEVMKSEVATF